MITRRALLGGALTVGAGFVASCAGSSGSSASESSRSSASPPRSSTRSGAPPPGSPELDLAELERRSGRRIGVAALATATGRVVARRADERFLMCSTGKVATVAAVLHAAERDPALLDRRVHYQRRQLVAHSPVTGAHVADGLTIGQLCAGALAVSDNTAENLLLSIVGGPRAVTAFVRTIGDRVSRFDRDEPELNVRVAAGLDTTTPNAMVGTLHRLLLDPATPAASRRQLAVWMRACTTGDQQIRAGAPTGWTVADKTGSGEHDESNDVAVLGPAGARPVVLCIYTAVASSARNVDTATNGPATIAAATRSALAALSA